MSSFKLVFNSKIKSRTKCNTSSLGSVHMFVTEVKKKQNILILIQTTSFPKSSYAKR